MSGCFTGVRTRRYIESKPRLEAKSFKPFLPYMGRTLTIKHPINAPKRFTLEQHKEYAGVLWFDVEGSERFPVPLQWDNTRYPRLIFICPCCANKRLYLYPASNGWACRKCLGLHYACQSESTMDRLGRAIRKRRRIIWGKDAEPSLFENSFPIKPKGRHYRTFESDFIKLVKVEDAYNVYFLKKLQSLGAGLGIDYF